MRILGIAALMALFTAGPAAAWPGMFLFAGYMTGTSVERCQDKIYAACSREFGNCRKSSAGRTLVVNHTGGVYNFSMQCTYFSHIDAVIYAIGGSGEKGKDGGLRDIVVRIKQYMDNN